MNAVYQGANQPANVDGQEDAPGVLKMGCPEGYTHDRLPHPNLYVEGLPASHLDPESVRRLFQAYGGVESVRVVKYVRSRSTRAFAFVRMSDTAAAAAALGLDGSHLHGAAVFVTLAEADARERPPKRGQDPSPCHTVYIKHVPVEWGPQQLAELFAPFGPVAHVRLLQDSASCSGSACTAAALVQLESVQAAAAAIAALHDQQLEGIPAPLIARFADPARTRQPQPRSSSDSGSYLSTEAAAAAAAAAAPAHLSSSGSNVSSSSQVGTAPMRQGRSAASTRATTGSSRDGLLACDSCGGAEAPLTAAVGGGPAPAASAPPSPPVVAGRRGYAPHGRLPLQGARGGSRRPELHTQQQQQQHQDAGAPPGCRRSSSSSSKGQQGCHTPGATRRGLPHSPGRAQAHGHGPPFRHHHQQQQRLDLHREQAQQQGEWDGVAYRAAEEQAVWQGQQQHRWSGGHQPQVDQAPARHWQQHDAAAHANLRRSSAPGAANEGPHGTGPGAPAGVAGTARQLSFAPPPPPLPLHPYLVPGPLPPGSLPLLVPPMHYMVPVAATYPPVSAASGAAAAVTGPLLMGRMGGEAPQPHASPPYVSAASSASYTCMRSSMPGSTTAAGAQEQLQPRPRQAPQRPCPQQLPAAAQGSWQACQPQPPLATAAAAVAPEAQQAAGHWWVQEALHRDMQGVAGSVEAPLRMAGAAAHESARPEAGRGGGATQARSSGERCRVEGAVHSTPGSARTSRSSSCSSSKRASPRHPSPGESRRQSAEGGVGDVEPSMAQLCVGGTTHPVHRGVTARGATESEPGRVSLPASPAAAAAGAGALAAGQPRISEPESSGAHPTMDDREGEEDGEKPEGSGSGTTIEVHNLPEYATSLLLYQTFGPVGAILTAHVKTNLFGTCTGTGYVTFRSAKDAAAAVRRCDQLTRPCGRSLHVVCLSHPPHDLEAPSHA